MEVCDTKLNLIRDGKFKVCSMDKCKLVKLGESRSPSQKRCPPGEDKRQPRKKTWGVFGSLLLPIKKKSFLLLTILLTMIVTIQMMNGIQIVSLKLVAERKNRPLLMELMKDIWPISRNI